jgi:hypothetical protein
MEARIIDPLINWLAVLFKEFMEDKNLINEKILMKILLNKK